jgi:armadillo repeat-containing protein 8
MTIQTVNISTLKRVKNTVIGNPSAKLVLAQDELFVATYVTTCPSSPRLAVSFIHSLVKCINTPEQFEEAAGSQDDIRVEAAQVITSLSYGAQSQLRTFFHVLIPCLRLLSSGSPEALRSLLLSNAHQAFLYAISRFSPSEPPATKAAFSRALRALAVACAELVGPSQWGLRDDSSLVRDDAKLALEYLFQVMRCVYWSLPTRPDCVCIARGSGRVPSPPHRFFAADQHLHCATPWRSASRT